MVNTEFLKETDDNDITDYLTNYYKTYITLGTNYYNVNEEIDKIDVKNLSTEKKKNFLNELFKNMEIFYSRLDKITLNKKHKNVITNGFVIDKIIWSFFTNSNVIEDYLEKWFLNEIKHKIKKGFILYSDNGTNTIADPLICYEIISDNDKYNSLVSNKYSIYIKVKNICKSYNLLNAYLYVSKIDNINNSNVNTLYNSYTHLFGLFSPFSYIGYTIDSIKNSKDSKLETDDSYLSSIAFLKGTQLVNKVDEPAVIKEIKTDYDNNKYYKQIAKDFSSRNAIMGLL